MAANDPSPVVRLYLASAMQRTALAAVQAHLLDAMPVAAYMLGARVIEKHFTLTRAMRGTDHRFSLEPVGMKKMIRDLQRTRMALGDGRKKVYASEAGPVLKMGKKLVAARDLGEGHVLTATDIAIKSPGDGLPPFYLDQLIGQTLSRALRTDETITLESIRPVASAGADRAAAGV